ncbi:MAG TPA: methyltransferase domain-containing protein [Gammaproteobacteria bacterium]|nr:methyltransferase domain-containing protein [Gammaproteobacteria bacterium]
MTEPTYRDSFSQNAAENYERYFIPSIGRPVAANLVEAAALHPGERVLDVACGTGIVARLAAEAVGPRGTVAGLDPHPGMLAVAREAAGSVAWHEAPAESIPLPDEGFDVVLCSMGLQFFSAREAGLAEMRRVLVPGGRLLVCVPGPAPPPLEALAEAFARHAGPESAAFVHAVFSLHDPDQIRALAKSAGFEDMEVRSEPVALRLPSPPDFLWQYVHSTPMAPLVDQIDQGRREALERDFSERCREFVKAGALVGAVRITTLIARR